MSVVHDVDDGLVEREAHARPVDPVVQARDAGRVVAESKKPADKKKDKRKRKGARAPPGVDAYSIDEFARRHAISTEMFFKLKREGKAPALMLVGRRVLISYEAAAAWRREREAEAAAAAAAKAEQKG